MNCNRTPEMGSSIYLNGCSCHHLWDEVQTDACDCFDRWPVGMTYVPMQLWEEPFELAKGLQEGTIFPSLRKPFKGGGC